MRIGNRSRAFKRVISDLKWFLSFIWRFQRQTVSQPVWDSWASCLPLCSTETLSLLRPNLTLQSAEVIIVPHKIIWSWYTGRWWMGCYIWYSEGGGWADCGPAQSPPHCTKCNSSPINSQCTNHWIAVQCLLLCGFNVPIKELIRKFSRWARALDLVRLG